MTAEFCASTAIGSALRVVAGIDPGATGAYAEVDWQGQLIGVWDTPNTGNGKPRVAAQAFALLLASRKPAHVYIERVSAWPGQGVSSSFAFGYSAGVIEGVLSALSVPISFVSPAVWKRTAGLTADKSSVRVRAMQLWPDFANEFRRIRDDGRAEACMIALHGLRALRGDKAA